MNTFVPKDNIKPLKSILCYYSFLFNLLNKVIYFFFSFIIVGTFNGKRLCRNVIIHGFCKFEDKGCEFNHENVKYLF